MTQESKAIYIQFFDGITSQKVNAFINFTLNAITSHKPTEIHYLISSNGGDVDSGFVLHNFLLSLRENVKIIMHNIGSIDSIANVIFLAAQERFAAPNASFLFHGISMNFQAGGYQRIFLKENLSRLDVMETRMSETISKNCSLTIPELTELFHQGESKNVVFALEKKIIHGIKDPVVPKGAVYLAIP